MSSQLSYTGAAAPEAVIAGKVGSKSGTELGEVEIGGSSTAPLQSKTSIDDEDDIEDIPYDEKFMEEEGPAIELWLKTPHIFSKTGDRKIPAWAADIVDWGTQNKLRKLSDVRYREVFRYISEQLSKVEEENLEAGSKFTLLERDVGDIRRMVLRKFRR